MLKLLTWFSLLVAVVMIVVFILDAVLGVEIAPFGGASKAFDIIGILCCLMLVYMSIVTIRDLR